MKQVYHLKSFLFASVFTLFIFSCQENQSASEIDLVDEDMEAATQLVDDYIASSDSRWSPKISITVLKYISGKLYYATSSDGYRGYREVNEETITADVELGENIFWFSGSGVTYLDGIEFDSDSESKLNRNAHELLKGRLWYITIPENAGKDGVDLKYDILYKCATSRGKTIRLDPKIKVGATN